MNLKWIVLAFILLTGCDDGEPSMVDSKVALVDIALNVPVKDVLDSSPIKFSQECMKDLGLCWYKIDKSAGEKNLPTVRISSPSGSLNLSDTIQVSIFVDEKVGSTVENLEVTVKGLPSNSSHKEYRDFIFEIINNVTAAGWKRYYFPSAPRISGSQSSKINSPDDVLGFYTPSHPWLDPEYPVDIDRWLKISFYDWYFYADGAYLHLKAWRRDSKENPSKAGTYLITLEFMTERDYWVSGFSEEAEKNQWKKLLPARLKSYRETRRVAEEKARAAGIDVDESYQDPPIKALEK